MEAIRTRLVTIGLLLSLLVIIPTSCKHIEYVTQAQEAFNSAAESEYDNILALREFSDDPYELEKINFSQSNYAIAYNRIEKAISSSRSKLEKDELLGTALTIQALCEWKLGKYTDAPNTANEALKYLENQPRDKSVMIALPGLIKADQAYNKLISTSNINVDYAQIKETVDGALEDFEDASIGLDGHPTRTYIQIATLSSIVTLTRAANLRTDSGASDEREQIREKYVKPQLEILGSLVGTESNVYKRFRFLLDQ